MSDAARQDIHALAKGGRTNVLGFVIRLAATAPFLFIASRLYGAEALGRFASAMVMIELAGQLCSLGQKRGLAQRLASDGDRPANTVADAMLLSTLLAIALGLALYALPGLLYPGGTYTTIDRLVVLAILPATLTDIALAALAYRYDIATSVRARAVVEPWTQSLAAGALFFVLPASGLSGSYILSRYASAAAALWPLVRSYGPPRGWRPGPGRLWRLALANLPLAAADAVEWGTRKLDIFVLRFFAGEGALGVYYFAQQVATLPQKLKTSFEPILGPVITRNLKDGNLGAIAGQVSQVGFWIIAAQAGIALALALPGEAVMGLGGADFVGGTGALALLLLAEVVAGAAVVSEAALVYVARLRNLWVSLFTIGLQAVLTVAGIELVKHLGLNQNYRAAAAAGALVISLAMASLIKARLLAHILAHPVNIWRWVLAGAALPAALAGWAVTRFLPEWAELLLGIPAILGLYGWIIWHKGFGAEDRVLFRRNVAKVD